MNDLFQTTLARKVREIMDRAGTDSKFEIASQDGFLFAKIHASGVREVHRYWYVNGDFVAFNKNTLTTAERTKLIVSLCTNFSQTAVGEMLEIPISSVRKCIK